MVSLTIPINDELFTELEKTEEAEEEGNEQINEEAVKTYKDFLKDVTSNQYIHTRYIKLSDGQTIKCNIDIALIDDKKGNKDLLCKFTPISYTAE